MCGLEEVSSWIDSDAYVFLLNCLSKDPGLRINYGAVPEVLLRFDVDSLRLSGLEVLHVSSIAKNSELVCNFVREKLSSLEGVEDEQEGKHLEDEEDIDVEEGPFFKNFLISYLIELHFLIFNPRGLEPYLKITRMPNARGYAKLLGDVYNRIS